MILGLFGEGNMTFEKISDRCFSSIPNLIEIKSWKIIGCFEYEFLFLLKEYGLNLELVSDCFCGRSFMYPPAIKIKYVLKRDSFVEYCLIVGDGWDFK